VRTQLELAQEMLEQFFKDWQQARARREMAQQTLSGAQADEFAKEARFKGAAELIHGKDATFEYDEKTGLKFIPPALAAKRQQQAKNRAGKRGIAR